MKPILFAAVSLACILMTASRLTAERIPDRPGSNESYLSENGKFELTITYGEPAHAWSLKKNGLELWKIPLLSEPGDAAVSDNGETITLPLWGWRDEGGSSGIAVYDNKGGLRREILFSAGMPTKDELRWVRKTSLSPEGNFIALGEHGKEHARITLFDALTGELLWETSAGLPDIVQLKVSEKGKYVLAATSRQNDGDMEFILLDRRGNVFRQRSVAENLSYEVGNYLQFSADLSGFGVLELKSGRFLHETIPQRPSTGL